MQEEIPKVKYQQVSQKEDIINPTKQNQPQVPNQIAPETQQKLRWSIVMMISYLYFIQGVVLSLGSTMPFIYPQLPSYSVLSIFALASIPFSFKFLTAPFSEKFNFVIYGKRKTWIIIAQIFWVILIFVISFFTKQQQATILALMMLVTIFFVTLQDISLDALTIKQLKSTKIAGVIQSTMQTAGGIFGGLLLLKLTSFQFASNYLHLKQPITTIDSLLKIIALLILVPTILIHFIFKQTVLESQVTFNQNKSIWDTILYYKIFFNISSKQCRMGILFLLCCQGFNLFDAGFQYELVKAGFSKDTLNTLGNIISAPVIVMTCFIGNLIVKFGIKQTLIVVSILTWIIDIYLYVIFPTDTITISILIFIGSVLSTARSLMISMMALGFPITAVTGMTVTMLYSLSNFGSNLTIATKLTDIYTWKHVALIGMIIQFVLIIGTYFYYDWMDKGNTGVQGQIIQQQNVIPNQQI